MLGLAPRASASPASVREAARNDGLDNLLLGIVLSSNPGLPLESVYEALESSQSHICGKVFEDGDVVYQCTDCGADKTYVEQPWK